ncbi:MAG: acetyl-CoA acetyltransferase [Syntrophaceae bacterium]|nr:acetyl-CoA acetyltransferase [Syntrophaceae bacterium]
MIHPVIVGVGQITNRSEDNKNALHPLQLAKMAIDASVEDSQCSGILSHIDMISVVNIFSWTYEDPASLLCEMLAVKPRVAEYTTIGGNTPQWLVNRAAKKIVRGEIEMALICGAEAMHTVSSARKANFILPWHYPKSNPAMVGDDRFGSSPVEIMHGASLPINVYPLFESALRAEHGFSIEDHKKFLADFCAGFSKIAAKNPLAWFKEEKDAQEIEIVTPVNRMIGFPYTKYMNPIINVNQAAAIIITSNEVARKLSISKDKWVYLHAGYDATDKWFISDRVSYTFSPAIKETVGAALESAKLNINEIDFFDLYSCFPCAPVIAAKSIGLNLNKLPPLTITGGLPYFGGAGNNYSLHAIAHAVERLRVSPEEFGLITALGWYITKHSAGIYSGREPQYPYCSDQYENIQNRIDGMQGPEQAEGPEGTAVVETYTVIHDRHGDPEYSIVIARLENGKRCWAQTEKDPELLRLMEAEEFIGKKGLITAGNNAPNLIRFC